MVKRKSSYESSEGEKNWNKIFSALVKLSRNLQEERHILEDRVQYLKDAIHKMKMEKKVAFAKEELLLFLKDREAFDYKNKFENVVHELDDFRECFNYLFQKQSNLEDTSGDINRKGGQLDKQLQDEVRKLRTEIEKCKFEKVSEISSLLAEKNFIWNQYKKMEGDYDKKMKNKCDEIECANEKIQTLTDRAEELQFTNQKLKSDFAKMESESIQKNEEISRLSKEVAQLKSLSGSRTPTLKKCRTGLRLSHMQSKTSSIDARLITAKKESDPAFAMEKNACTRPVAHKSTGGKAPRKNLGSKGSSSKVKEVDVITIVDSPKLFTSSFKIPKLKLPSPQVI